MTEVRASHQLKRKDKWPGVTGGRSGAPGGRWVGRGAAGAGDAAAEAQRHREGPWRDGRVHAPEGGARSPSELADGAGKPLDPREAGSGRTGLAERPVCSPV